VFTCTHCNAVPELVVDGNAQLAIVRHDLGWPDAPPHRPVIRSPGGGPSQRHG